MVLRPERSSERELATCCLPIASPPAAKMDLVSSQPPRMGLHWREAAQNNTVHSAEQPDSKCISESSQKDSGLVTLLYLHFSYFLRYNLTILYTSVLLYNLENTFSCYIINI